MRRTNTTEMALFTLPPPDNATFEFNPASLSSPIRIVIQPQGKWRMPLHWHPHENNNTVLSCKRLVMLSGPLHVFTVKGTSGGCDTLASGPMEMEFELGQRVAWGREKGIEERLVVDLVADHTLWRNICSSVLDKDIFPQLTSTPFWLKAVFAILSYAPPLRRTLLNMMLWVQLQAIFFSHDFYIYYGRIPFTWLWICQPFGGDPPDRAKHLTLKSEYLISRLVMTTAYYAGLMFLGIKERYSEYTQVNGNPP
ncbi:hypothetical protein NM208_g1268 [Fusarium decemcellulare]|uniref:Uncharacterized protein n=1 Tax=Fusarium decemcellulare TaxID=57161 RepID=A0ACC1SWR6_9HYPO|nr:hypothetical protein NM208_g1268 [Fusarium decemcellulare]